MYTPEAFLELFYFCELGPLMGLEILPREPGIPLVSQSVSQLGSVGGRSASVSSGSRSAVGGRLVGGHGAGAGWAEGCPQICATSQQTEKDLATDK